MLIDPKAAFHLGIPAELSTEDLIVAVLTAAVRRPSDWSGDCDDLAEWLGCSLEEAEPIYAVHEALRAYLPAIAASCINIRDLLAHLRAGGRAYFAAHVGMLDVPPQVVIADTWEAASLALYEGSGADGLEAEPEGFGRWIVRGRSSLGDDFTERWDLERIRL